MTYKISIEYKQGLIDPRRGGMQLHIAMPVETAKCWWLLKIEPNAWAGGKLGICVDLQAVGTLKFFGELYSGFGPFLSGFGQALEKGRVLFLVTTSTSPSLLAYAELHALSLLHAR